MLINNNVLNNVNILIVDDVLDNIEILRKMLIDQECHISVSLNGKQALKCVNKLHPDLILLDIIMPEMDGFEVCRQIKLNEQTKDISIIFISAKTEKDDIVKGFELGAVDYITKPFEHEEVLARIITHIKLSQTVKKNEQLIKDLKNHILLLKEAHRESLAKSEFMSWMNCEMRTPMNAILGFSQLLEQSRNTQENPNDKESVSEVLRAGKQLQSLIDNALALSQIEINGYNKSSLKEICLFESINDAISSISFLADSLNIKIVNNIPEKNDFNIYGDSKLIHRILSLLLNDAIKFNIGGTVVLEQKIAEDGNLHISVIKTGSNPSDDLLEKIFDPLSTLEIYKKLTDGRGRELVLAKNFAKLMDGAILAIRLDYGFGFSLIMPAVQMSYRS
jgi:two-component system, sensor histidine kinase and response regulator